MAKAGFDPRGAVTLWEILTEVSQSSSPRRGASFISKIRFVQQVEEDVTNTGEHGTITDHIALLRTHPTGEQRLAVSLKVLTLAASGR